jgi:hypothetical protein
VGPDEDDDRSAPPPDDLFSRGEVTAHVGFPEFEHNQWTVEGEIERLGAFSRGSHHVRGWRRAVAVLLALIFILPLAYTVLAFALGALGRLIGW